MKLCVIQILPGFLPERRIKVQLDSRRTGPPLRGCRWGLGEGLGSAAAARMASAGVLLNWGIWAEGEGRAEGRGVRRTGGL